MEIEFNNFNGYYIQPELKQTIKHLKEIIVDGGEVPPLITLVGPIGSGKRTLAKALAQEYLQQKEKNQLLKIRTEEVVEQFITSIRESKKFGQSLMDADILVITDLEEICNKDQTFNALRSIFKMRVDMGKPVILTANIEDYPINDRLQRYFNIGFLIHIQLPGFYLRRKLVAESIKKFDYEVPEEISEYIADHVISDMNLIHTIVRNLVIGVLKEDKKLDLTHVNHIMKDFISIKGQWV